MKYHIDGYTVSRSLINLDVLSEIESYIENILREKTSYEYYENNILIRIENFITTGSRLEKLLLNEKVLKKVETFLGGKPSLFKDKVNFKSPGGTPDVLHQDIQARWNDYGTEDFVTIGIPLDECNIETSCVYFFKNQSKNPKKRLGDYFEPLSWDDFDKNDFKPLIASPGDVSFHDAFIPHYSESQKSKHLRRIIWLTFNKASCGNLREKYYADKLKSYPPNNKRNKDKKYEFKV